MGLAGGETGVGDCLARFVALLLRWGPRPEFVRGRVCVCSGMATRMRFSATRHHSPGRSLRACPEVEFWARGASGLLSVVIVSVQLGITTTLAELDAFGQMEYAPTSWFCGGFLLGDLISGVPVSGAGSVGVANSQ